MLKDFEAIKAQLAELADVINKFKSEAVQLRIVELVLQGKNVESGGESSNEVATPKKGKKKRKPASSSTNTADGKKKRASGGTGAIATLVKVYGEGFFSKPRTISDILAHCETNLARRIKANEISGKLGRMVRTGELKRTKNTDNQYEYTRP
ncbi:MAG: hypothetical protein OEV08_08425 [Nitrospira sp.]|nr:hypothetical protein [Nitrospira sp.]